MNGAKSSADTSAAKLPTYPQQDVNLNANSASRHGSKGKKILNMSRLQELNEMKLAAVRKKMTQT